MISERYLELLDQLADLHRRKNAGYSGADNPDPWHNFRQCANFGIAPADGVVTRMSDKWNRLQSLWRDASNEQVGESIKDTLMDLSAYALILICMMEETATQEVSDAETPPALPSRG